MLVPNRGMENALIIDGLCQRLWLGFLSVH